MSFPTNTPSVFAPYAESCGDALECWPQFPMDRSSENCPHIETPLFKKPKISETVTNLRMPGSNNKVMTDTFFKTQLCMKFRLGTCINGDECNFAHGTGDIRRPLPHGQELSCKEGYVAGIWNRDHRLNSKMKLCRIFSRGEKCPYGERCNFLHEGFEKCREGSGKFRESSSISIGCTGSARGYRNGSGQLEFKRFGDSSLNANQVNANPGFWRTRLCHKWEMSGNCAYREKCVFAHGQAELRKHAVQPEGGKEHAAPKTLPSAKAGALTHKTGPGATYNQPLQEKKCAFKWEKLGKINGIYADWIDDMPLVHSSVK